MTFAFYLKDKNKKEGTPLVLVISHNNHKYKKQIGISVRPSEFKKQRVKDESVNRRLRAIEIRLNERLNQFSSEDDIRKAIAYAISDDKNPKSIRNGQTPSFWQYFDEWSKRESTSRRQRRLVYTTLARLMGTQQNWEDIDSSYHFRLCQKMNEEGFSVNYQWNLVTRLKCVMNEGYKLKYHTNTEFREFPAPKEEAEAIALTPDEIELLWAYDPKDGLFRQCRDLFLIGYYTAARFSDYSRISKDNIHDGMVDFVQQKTGDRVVLPASSRLISLLDENGGKAPKVNQVVFNRYIKRVAKEAGIVGVVQLPKTRQKKDGTPTLRWEMVMSHTARRSAITNLYLSGVPAKDCMFLSGHKSIRSFEHYLKISKEQAAERLSRNPFFK